MAFSILALVTSLDPFQLSAIALGIYGSLGMIPGVIWKSQCNNLYLQPLKLEFYSRP